jgi:RNA polymerase sigma-70 factor (ECF subfamily)
MPAEVIPDAQLVAGIAAGDAEAFSLLFRRRQGDVYRYALHMTASPSVAEDVTQEVFVAVMQDAARFSDARGSVTAWLCGIARNQVRRRLERDRPLQPVGEEDSVLDGQSLDDDPLGDLTKAERIDALRRAVLTLPVQYREAVVLCDLQELSYVEAAVALGCAVGTVRSRLHRGRALLSQKLTASVEPETSRPQPDLSRTEILSRASKRLGNLA